MTYATFKAKSILLAVLMLLFAGCSGMQPKEVHDVKEVKVAVAVPCVDEKPVPPKLHTDAEIKAMDDYHVIYALLLDRVASAIYTLRLEAVISGCK